MLLMASSVCGLFKWRQFEPEVILLAVGWYLRFPLSYPDAENGRPSKMFTFRQVPAPICRIQEEATAKQCEKILRLE
jgi:hypothetical protein